MRTVWITGQTYVLCCLILIYNVHKSSCRHQQGKSQTQPPPLKKANDTSLLQAEKASVLKIKTIHSKKTFGPVQLHIFPVCNMCSV